MLAQNVFLKPAFQRCIDVEFCLFSINRLLSIPQPTFLCDIKRETDIDDVMW